MQKKADFPRIASLIYYLIKHKCWKCVFLGCLLSSCYPSSPSDEKLSDNSQNPLTPKVISLAPNITEIIYALGGEKKLLARSQACDFPKEAQDLPVVKTYPMVDWEQILYYQPDIVWATDELYSPDVIDLLTSRNIPLKLQSYKSLEDLFTGILEIGEVMGYPVQAQQLIDSLQGLGDSYRNNFSETPKAMLWISDEPLVVAGGLGYMQGMLEHTGWANVYEENSEPYVNTTVEELLYKNPSTIFFPTSRQGHIKEVFASFPVLKGLEAYQKKRIFQLEPDLIYRPGPRLIKGLKRLTSYRRQLEHEGEE